MTKDDIDHDLSLHEQVLEHEWLMHLSPEQFGPWRAVMSAKTKRPFFFNEITKMGQYKIPAELEALKPQPHDGRGSSQSQTRELEHTSVTIVATQNPTQINSQQMRFNSQSELQATMVEDLQSTLVDPTPIAIGSSIQYSEGDLFNLSQHMQPANVNVMPAPDASDDLFTLGIVPTNVQQGGDEGSVVEVQDESKADKGSNKPSHWTCALCTFINKKFSSKCSMCDSDNPDYFNISNKPRRSMRNTPFNFNDVPTQATNNMSSSKATQQSILGFGSPPPLGANTQTANKKSKR